MVVTASSASRVHQPPRGIGPLQPVEHQRRQQQEEDEATACGENASMSRVRYPLLPWSSGSSRTVTPFLSNSRL